MPSLRTVGDSPAVAQDTIDLPSTFPSIPDDVKARFPDMADYDDQLAVWWKRMSQSLSDMTQSVATVTNQVNTNTQNLSASFGDFKAEITTEISVIVDDVAAQATEIVTVSAMAGIDGNISVQGTPPGTPALNDYWIDTSLTPATTKKWSGAAWVVVLTPIAFAGVATEKTARVTADGFLSSKYTMTVIAGNVITGFNITSASGPGTNISNVSFTAGSFNIYDGVTNFPIFTTTVGAVALAGTLVVNTSGKVFIGGGLFNNAGTPFYVDLSGNFSLGTKLTWNGSALVISGSITATSGAIGGWAIGATTLTGGNAILDSAGQLILGTANNIVYLSATDATYRLWVGNVTSASATFSVTKAGALFSTSGTIGGFTIGATTITGGSVTMDSTGNYRSGQTAYNTGVGFWLGFTGGAAKVSLGDPANNYFTYDGSAFTIGYAGIAGVNFVSSGSTVTMTANAVSDYFEFSYHNIGAVGVRGVYLRAVRNLGNDSEWGINYFRAPIGTATNPGLSFFVANKTGLNAATDAELDIIRNGSVVAYFDSTGLNISVSVAGVLSLSGTLTAANTSTVAHSLITGNATGSVQSSYALTVINRTNTTTKYGVFVGTNWAAVENKILTAGNVDATTGAVTEFFDVFGNGQSGFASGNAAAPGIAFLSDLTTGIYLNAAGDMQFACSGVRQFVVRASGTPKIICFQPLQLANAYVAGLVAATGTVTILDNGGNVLRVLVANP